MHLSTDYGTSIHKDGMSLPQAQWLDRKTVTYTHKKKKKKSPKMVNSRDIAGEEEELNKRLQSPEFCSIIPAFFRSVPLPEVRMWLPVRWPNGQCRHICKTLTNTVILIVQAGERRRRSGGGGRRRTRRKQMISLSLKFIRLKKMVSPQ